MDIIDEDIRAGHEASLAVMAQVRRELSKGNGPSLPAILRKLSDLLDAKETKFFAHQGEVVSKEEVEALHIQLGALAKAMELYGLTGRFKIDFNATVAETSHTTVTIKDQRAIKAALKRAKQK
jgi:hypothetical protein